MRKCLRIVPILLLSVVVIAGVSAQLGTPNVPSATTWQDQTLWQAEARFYKSGNNTLALGALARLAERTDLTVWYTYLNNDSHSPLGGAMRDSRWSGLSFALRQELKDEGAPVKMALMPSLEVALKRAKGTNTTTGAFAEEQRVTPAVAVPVEWLWGTTTMILCPRLVWFEESIDDSTGGVTQGFGTQFSLGAGVRHPLGRGALVGDVAYPFSGHNSLATSTNTPNRKALWSAGWEGLLGGGGDTWVTLYATNGTGPSLATSAIAAPGNGVGLGVRVGHIF